MMSSRDFSSIIGSLDEFNTGVVLKELRSISVGMSDGLGKVRILLAATPFVVVFLLVAILKFNARV